jgi:hypothetical protein
MKLKMDYKWVALSVTTVGSFMATLDSSIVVVGLPTVLGELHASICSWHLDHHRLQTDANDPAGDARAAGRSIRQSETL